MNLSIVIPVYNEKESLSELVSQIETALKKSDLVHEYIFVDDGSTDGSWEKLLALKKKLKNNFKLIRFRKNLGKSAALSVGFSQANGDQIITMDADLQDDPNEIIKLLEKLNQGYDLVVGWRKKRYDPENKIRNSRLFNAVVTKVGHLTLHDINCGLKAFNKNVVREIGVYGEMHRFIPLLAVNKGFKVTEVPVVHHPRKYGNSKFGTYRALHAFFDLITTMFISSFKNRPLQVFGLTGSILIIIGTVILVYLSLLHFLGESIGRRPLLFLGILIVLSGVQIFSTGLLGELIAYNHAHTENYPVEKIIE